MTRLLNRLGLFLGRVRAWFKRRPCVTGLLALVASAALVTYGFVFFAPDKIRNLGKKLVGHIEFATQLLPATLPS